VSQFIWGSRIYDVETNDHLITIINVVWSASSRRALLLLHFSGMLVPSLLLLSIVYSSLLLFIPIMGRTGNASYPDIFVGCAVACTMVLLSLWQVVIHVYSLTLRRILLHGRS